MSRENLESRKENSIMSVVLAATAAHSVKTMNNNDMGSKVNRVKCTGEHVKNDTITGIRSAAMATVPAVGVLLATKKPQCAVRLTQCVGEGLKGLSKLVGKFSTGKFAAGLRLFGEKIVKAAPKYGKAAVIAAFVGPAVLGLAKIATDHAYKAGQIDQKYIDNAKLEKMTNSVIV